MSTGTQAPAAPYDDPEHAHVLPLKVYLGVYGALLVLTALTVGVSLADLGALAIFVAMGVAVVKAGLVVGYFMHLKFDARLNSLVFFGSLLFLVIFFVLTMADIATRGQTVEETGNFVLQEENQKKDRAALIEASGQKVSPIYRVKDKSAALADDNTGEPVGANAAEGAGARGGSRETAGGRPQGAASAAKGGATEEPKPSADESPSNTNK